MQDNINEFTSFPVAAHDDQVDATTQALIRWLPSADQEPAVGEARVFTAEDLFDGQAGSGSIRDLLG